MILFEHLVSADQGHNYYTEELVCATGSGIQKQVPMSHNFPVTTVITRLPQNLTKLI